MGLLIGRIFRAVVVVGGFASGPSAALADDGEWTFNIQCNCEVPDCVVRVGRELAGESERFPAATYQFLALSQSLVNRRGELLVTAFIGISPALPRGLYDGALTPAERISMMLTRDPPPDGEFSRRDAGRAEAQAISAAAQDLARACRRTPDCEDMAPAPSRPSNAAR